MSAQPPFRAFRLVSVGLFLFACLGPSPAGGGEADRYTLAVVPRTTPIAVHRDWAPLAERLSRETRLSIRLKVYQSYEEFDADLLKGVPDLVFMSPYHAVRARRAQGYIPLVRDGAKPLTGVLVVHRDSPVRTLRDLDGGEIAFPSPNAFGSSLYMRSLLTEKEKIRFTPRYVGSHTNVYRHVILGKAAAGGGVVGTLGKQPPEVRNQLRIVYETPSVAPHPLGAHPRVPKEVRHAVTEAMLRLGADEAARGLLDAVSLSRPVPADYARDYQRLEQLNLEKYVSHEPF
ncbi:MAG: phosphate/phosphite/phosphonate ABC transporter substrate-binding protein [Nitrospirae bacterium]|nr:phosphate/phosphite/phosphonate ABC transporter substrate-binding protein [Nitrospirota bacterium]MBI3393105.1 phosphate/phosphite/phosphonate ABC transporter substrate-binding protein [Nitrospirota bacterium]